MSKGQTWKKKCPKPSWQALTPPDKVGKKVLQTIPPMPIWKQHIPKRGFPKGEFLIICLRTSKTKQGEVQRRSSSVWLGPKSRWSTACSFSSSHREFCIQPLDEVEKRENMSQISKSLNLNKLGLSPPDDALSICLLCIKGHLSVHLSFLPVSEFDSYIGNHNS